MPRTARFHSRCRVNPALVLIALLGILTMPVDYRAGAAMPHPHATLQLIGDLASGSFAHHGDERDGAGHSHGTRHHRHRTLAAPVLPAPLNLVEDDGALPPHRVSTMIDLAARASDRAVSDDAPTLSPRTGGGMQMAYAVVLPAVMIWFGWWLVHRLDWAAAVRWSGLTDLPELPPPRHI